MGELYPVRGLVEHTGPDFREALIALADRLALDPTALAAVMSFETAGDFRTGRHSEASSATGLIGFMGGKNGSAARLGTSVEALAAMSQLEQLSYVERYFAPMASRIRTVADHYMAVFAPSGIGKGAGFVLYAAPSDAYAANAGLDRDRDGAITVSDASRGVEGLYAAAKAQPPMPRESGGSSSPRAGTSALGALLLSALGTWVVMRWGKGRRR